MIPNTHFQVAILWLCFSAAAALLIGVTGGLIRLELAEPGVQYPELTQAWNLLISAHGVLAVYFGVLPLLFGAVPHILLLRSQLFSSSPVMWLAPVSLMFCVVGLIFSLIGLSLSFGRQMSNSGWTLYAPLSVNSYDTKGTELLLGSVLALQIGLCLNGVLSAIESVRIIKHRKHYAGPVLIIFGIIFAFIVCAPFVYSLLQMVIIDRNFGVSFFDPAVVGDPILHQHILWFFGNYQTQLFIVAAVPFCLAFISGVSGIAKDFGRVNWILAFLPAFTAFVFSVLGFAGLALIVGNLGAIVFIIYVQFQCFGQPEKIRLGHLWLASISIIAANSLSGFYTLAAQSHQLDDTYYVVAQLHYTLAFPFLFVLIGTFWHFLASYNGQRPVLILGAMHFWAFVVSYQMAFLPKYYLGLMGMPRRYPDYPDLFTSLNFLSSLGSYLILISFVLVPVGLWAFFLNRETGRPRT